MSSKNIEPMPKSGPNSYSQVHSTDSSRIEDKESTPKATKSMKFYPNSHEAKIDAERARFPYCIVWTPLPLISWFLPFIGHTGIALSDGVIHDFSGPY